MSSYDLAIVTGEFPPQHGGVADYLGCLVDELQGRGVRTLVVAPEIDGMGALETRADVVRIRGGFAPASLPRLSRVLRGQAERVFLHYLPHAFGCRSVNAPFVAWACSRPEPLWTMFHEVALGFEPGRLRINAAALVHRAMAVALARRSERTFVSTSAWRNVAGTLGSLKRAEWLPIPSTLEGRSPRSGSRTTWRMRTQSEGRPLIGHFGTYGLVREGLAALLAPLLSCSDAQILLIGRGSKQFTDAFLAAHPELSPRVIAAGALSEDDLTDALAACDIALQPFPDGITTRRTSAMAALALGVPLVSNFGALSERFWEDAEVLVSIELHRPQDAAQRIAQVLREPGELARRSEHGRELYRREFSSRAIVDRLLAPPNEMWAPSS